MSRQLQTLESLVKTENLMVIKNQPLETEIVEIGIDDILDSSESEEEIIPDVKDMDIVYHPVFEQSIKSEILESKHCESVETQVLIKTENFPVIKTETITQRNKTGDTSDKNVTKGTGQAMVEVQGSNEYSNVLSTVETDAQLVLNFSKYLNGISTRTRKAKQPEKTNFAKCYQTVKTTSWKKDKEKKEKKTSKFGAPCKSQYGPPFRNILPVKLKKCSPAGVLRPPPEAGLLPPLPVIPVEAYEYTSLAEDESQDHKNNADGKNNQDNEKMKPHIKKPLNAFMLYMKEMRAKVVAECTLKESAAINQVLGRRWHSLSREEQAKYYEKARLERQLHMQLYPGWSVRDNYGYRTKKKKRKKKRAPIEWRGMKKCRARYGLDQRSQWCRPCRLKKKCLRYMESGESNDDNQSDDNLGSCGNMGDANTPPDDDNESLNQSMSSPGGLSVLNRLTSSGGMVLPSPSTSVVSPSVSVASSYMLQSSLMPHDSFDVKPSNPFFTSLQGSE